MSEANSDNPMTAAQLVGIVLASIVGIPVFIVLLVKLFTGGMHIDADSKANSAEAVATRIKAVGYSKLDESGPPGSRNGKAVYENVCTSCHAAGLAGAPKFGDSAAWAPRISKGYDTLVSHAIKGLNAMPAKGGAADLTDDEVARAVAYIGNAAGGKFNEPAVKVAAAAASAAADAAPAAAPAPAPAAAPAATAVAAAEPAGKPAAGKGKEIYESVCTACHSAGLVGAPKFGDKAAWAPRISRGLNDLVASATKGKGAMPPKGGFSGSDAEFRAAVEYVVNASK